MYNNTLYLKLVINQCSKAIRREAQGIKRVYTGGRVSEIIE